MNWRVIFLLMGSVLLVQGDNKVQKMCDEITDYQECIDESNHDPFDTSKCVIIETHTGQLCSSMKDVRKNGYQIDFEQGQSFITNELKNDIDKLLYHVKWASYNMATQVREKKLDDFEIIYDE